MQLIFPVSSTSLQVTRTLPHRTIFGFNFCTNLSQHYANPAAHLPKTIPRSFAFNEIIILTIRLTFQTLSPLVPSIGNPYFYHWIHIRLGRLSFRAIHTSLWSTHRPFFFCIQGCSLSVSKINTYIIWIQLISPLLIPLRARDTAILHYSPLLSAPLWRQLRKQIQLFDLIFTLVCRDPVWVSLLMVILRKAGGKKNQFFCFYLAVLLVREENLCAMIKYLTVWQDSVFFISPARDYPFI